jgi:hypothetical protein
VPVA